MWKDKVNCDVKSEKVYRKGQVLKYEKHYFEKPVQFAYLETVNSDNIRNI